MYENNDFSICYNKEVMKKLNHLAIIMDGNGRYAKKRNMPRSFGHEKGAKILLESAKWGKQLGINMITYYVFSTENWKRSEKEISFLFKLPILFFDKYFNDFINEGIKVNIIGDRDQLPDKLNKKLDEVVELTKDNDKITVNLAINYGGRREITTAVKKISEEVSVGKIGVSKITEDTIAKYLYLENDVDLVIRTSGEMRISNFLLWQIAYSELYVTDCLWPDFSFEEMNKAVEQFLKRDRRFGGVKDE